MENIKYYDCPRCLKNSVVGYKIEPDYLKVPDKLLRCATADSLFCVGVGAAAIAAIVEANTLTDGRIVFQFQCPSCEYRFIENLK